MWSGRPGYTASRRTCTSRRSSPIRLPIPCATRRRRRAPDRPRSRSTDDDGAVLSRRRTRPGTACPATRSVDGPATSSARPRRAGPPAVGSPDDDDTGLEPAFTSRRCASPPGAPRSTGIPHGQSDQDLPISAGAPGGAPGTSVMTRSARLVMELARRAACDRPGTLRFEGAGLPGGQPHRDRVGRPGGLSRGTRPEGLARRARPGLARAGRELHRRVVGHGRSDSPRAVAFRRTTPLRERLDAWASGPVPLLAGEEVAPASEQERRPAQHRRPLRPVERALLLDARPNHGLLVRILLGRRQPRWRRPRWPSSRGSPTNSASGPEDHVVEIGTGWGGRDPRRRAARLPRHHDHDLRGPALVRREARCRARLADRVTVLGADYRDLEGRYDALVSIEMIEAVDWRRHDQFFATCARLLTDRGRMALQAITIADGELRAGQAARRLHPRHGVPGGLPSLGQRPSPASVARTSDLRIVDLEDIGLHYAETLRRWRPTWSASATTSSAWASTSASGGSGPSTSDIAKRRSWSATCPTYRSFCRGAACHLHAGARSALRASQSAGAPIKILDDCRPGAGRRRRSRPQSSGPRALLRQCRHHPRARAVRG